MKSACVGAGVSPAILAVAAVAGCGLREGSNNGVLSIRASRIFDNTQILSPDPVFFRRRSNDLTFQRITTASPRVVVRAPDHRTQPFATDDGICTMVAFNT